MEYEKKMMLDEKEYLFLKRNWCHNGTMAVQINRYYDTWDEKLRSRGITCRIRKNDGKCTATVKNHRTDCFDGSMEYSQQVRGLWDDEIFRSMGLTCKGMLTTERITLRISDGIEVMLDRNLYLSTIDYELEVEYATNMEMEALYEIELLLRFLYIGGVINDINECKARIGNSGNKSERFFARKEELGQNSKNPIESS